MPAGGIIAAPPAAEPLDLPARLSRIELPTEVRHASYREPLGQAEAANIVLSLSSFPTTVQALTEGDALIEAEVDYIGQMRFDVTGARTRYVVLDEERSGWSMSLGTQRSAHRWEIGLSPDLPIDLTIDAGSGSSQLELGQLNLRSLLVDGGSGSVHLSLPHQELPVRVDSGSGSCHIELPEGARTDLRLNTGSGSVEVRLGEAADVRITAQDVGSGSLTFRLPADSAVQLTVDDEGSGSIRTPRGLDRVKGRSGEDVGVWESKDYGRAERQVTIRVDDMGSGSVSLEWDR